MEYQSENIKGRQSLTVAEPVATNREVSVPASQLFHADSPQASPQGKLHEMANSSPQVMQLKSYQQMADSSRGRLATGEPKSISSTYNLHFVNHSSVVQRAVIDKEGKPVDIDEFIKIHLVPQYAKYEVQPAKQQALTAHLRSKLVELFAADEEDPMPIESILSYVRGGMGHFNIERALEEIRPKPEGDVSVSDAAVESSAEEPLPNAVSAELVDLPSSVAVESSAESESVAEREPGNPNSLATDMFYLIGGGKYGSTTEVEAEDVDELVEKSIDNNVKLTVLTGTHGDRAGWLIGEESFASSDTKALESHGIIVKNVNGLTKGAIKALIDGASTPAVILAWCYSKVSFEKWDTIHAIFTKKAEFLSLNDDLRDLIDRADEICESENEQDKVTYQTIKDEIAATKASMLELLDW